MAAAVVSENPRKFCGVGKFLREVEGSFGMMWSFWEKVCYVVSLCGSFGMKCGSFGKLKLCDVVVLRNVEF